MSKYNAKIALLGGTIDYAGTFPPAALPLDKALAVAARYRLVGKHPWLMSKIALPLKDIKEVDTQRIFSSGADGASWFYTALGTAVETAMEFLPAVEWDLREMRRLNEKRLESACRQWIIGYERKLPQEWLISAKADEILTYLEPSLLRLKDLAAPSIIPFFEVGEPESWGAVVEPLADALSGWKHENAAHWSLGLKFRTGGKVQPSTEQLAAAIFGCAKYGVRFKATQGLHHCVSNAAEFGFVNLFATLGFAFYLGIEEFGMTEIQRCLEEKKAENFKWGESLTWGNFSLSAEQIEEARRVHGATFGSCSLDEPDEDLSSVFPD